MKEIIVEEISKVASFLFSVLPILIPLYFICKHNEKKNDIYYTGKLKTPKDCYKFGGAEDYHRICEKKDEQFKAAYIVAFIVELCIIYFGGLLIGILCLPVALLVGLLIQHNAVTEKVKAADYYNLEPDNPDLIDARMEKTVMTAAELKAFTSVAKNTKDTIKHCTTPSKWKKP